MANWMGRNRRSGSAEQHRSHHDHDRASFDELDAIIDGHSRVAISSPNSR